MSKKGEKDVETNGSRMCVHDFTINLPDLDDYGESIYQLHTQLRKICKKYTFQLEKGEKKGRMHFQGRLSLKEKTTTVALATLLRDVGIRAHLSVTSNENRKNDFYVMKEETRVSGPYTEEQFIEFPRDVLAMVKLRPWQRDLVGEIINYSERTVNILYDPFGNIGKTRFCRYMMCHKDAQILPFCNEYKDIMRMAYDVGAKPVYLIDIPRAICKKKLSQMFSAIETLKSGYAYDDRNTFKQRIFDPPRIVVFTNNLPDRAMLSDDMWKVHQVIGNELQDYDRSALLIDSTVESSSDDDSLEAKHEAYRVKKLWDKQGKGKCPYDSP